HLCPVFLRERCPFGGRGDLLSALHRFEARRQVRKPDVVPVLRGELGLGHAARRPAHRTDAGAFAATSGRSETDDAYAHFSALPILPASFDDRLRYGIRVTPVSPPHEDRNAGRKCLRLSFASVIPFELEQGYRSVLQRKEPVLCEP